ncbi:MAG: biopolymer transporter ExbD [Brevinematales bacterium]|jgi:biopolymer transport protein ExbD
MKLPRKYKLAAGIDPVAFLNIFFLIFMFYVLNPHKQEKQFFDVSSAGRSLGIHEAFITLHKNGSVTLNGSPVAWDSLGIRVREMYNSDTNITFTIKSGKAASFGRVIDTMNIIRLSGIKKLRLDEDINNE